MISIIICSRTHNISQELHYNISSTIGVEHEIIVIDNSQNQYSIFSAYNEGIERSNGDYLCFMHEDVFMHSQDWGKELQNSFVHNPNCGCLGVMGGHVLPKHPCYWCDVCFESYYYQRYNNETKLINKTDFFNSQGYAEVAACDGAWMCIPSKLFHEKIISFDTKTYNGFHMYDMDICMQVRACGMRTFVTENILIEHRNNIEESRSASFFEAQKVWYQKWKDSLPIIVGVNEQQLIEGMEKWVEHAQQVSYNHGVFITTQTASYRLGHALLQPFVLIKRLFHR